MVNQLEGHSSVHFISHCRSPTLKPSIFAIVMINLRLIILLIVGGDSSLGQMTYKNTLQSRQYIESGEYSRQPWPFHLARNFSDVRGSTNINSQMTATIPQLYDSNSYNKRAINRYLSVRLRPNFIPEKILFRSRYRNVFPTTRYREITKYTNTVTYNEEPHKLSQWRPGDGEFVGRIKRTPTYTHPKSIQISQHRRGRNKNIALQVRSVRKVRSASGVYGICSLTINEAGRPELRHFHNLQDYLTCQLVNCSSSAHWNVLLVRHEACMLTDNDAVSSCVVMMQPSRDIQMEVCQLPIQWNNSLPFMPSTRDFRNCGLPIPFVADSTPVISVYPFVQEGYCDKSNITLAYASADQFLPTGTITPLVMMISFCYLTEFLNRTIVIEWRVEITESMPGLHPEQLDRNPVTGVRAMYSYPYLTQQDCITLVVAVTYFQFGTAALEKEYEYYSTWSSVSYQSPLTPAEEDELITVHTNKLYNDYPLAKHVVHYVMVNEDWLDLDQHRSLFHWQHFRRTVLSVSYLIALISPIGVVINISALAMLLRRGRPSDTFTQTLVALCMTFLVQLIVLYLPRVVNILPNGFHIFINLPYYPCAIVAVAKTLLTTPDKIIISAIVLERIASMCDQKVSRMAKTIYRTTVGRYDVI